MVDIPEQAVKAAIRGYASSKQHTFDGQIHDALTAAAPHMSGVNVKQLEWSVLGCMHKADLYEIEDMGPNWGKDRYQLWYNKEVLQGVFGTLDEAKSAAQEDFEDNVRECIDGGFDVSSVRRHALEEAAKLIEEGFEKAVGQAWRNDGKPSKNDRCPHGKFMYEDCERCASAAIRELKSQPAAHSQSLVIIESPYAGDIAANESYARACLLDCLRRGEAPIASHLLHTQVLDDMQPDERKLGIEAGLAWYRVADKCVVYTDRGVSGGMAKGIERANRFGVLVEYRTLKEGQVAHTGGGDD